MRSYFCKKGGSCTIPFLRIGIAFWKTKKLISRYMFYVGFRLDHIVDNVNEEEICSKSTVTFTISVFKWRKDFILSESSIGYCLWS